MTLRDTQLCLRCSDHSPLDALWYAGTREGALKKLVDAYKFDAAYEARLQKVPYTPLLQRSRQAVQHQSSRQVRLRQARELFKASDSMPREVLLVDDVLTTGATLEAAARVLKAAGAQHVYGAVIVRQPLD